MPIIQAIANVLNVNPLWIVGKEETKELQQKVLKMPYYQFALKLQEKEISEKELELLWDFCELIAKHNST